jgi:hypothetical protein
MPPSSVAQRCPSRFINLRNDTPWARIENTIAYRSLPRASCTPCRQAGTGQARWRRRRAVRLIGARSLSDLGLIYRAGGRAAHSSPISRSIAPLCASKSANSVLALPPCSLRSPKSDRLLAPACTVFIPAWLVVSCPVAFIIGQVSPSVHPGERCSRAGALMIGASGRQNGMAFTQIPDSVNSHGIHRHH